MKRKVKQLIKDMKKIGFRQVYNEDEVYTLFVELNNCRETRVYFVEEDAFGRDSE